MGGLLNEDEFERVAASRCGGWSARSLDAARRVFVYGQKTALVATHLGMKPQQVNVIRERFLTRLAAKVSVGEYMGEVKPDRDVRLAPFKGQVRVLIKSGYSAQQIADFLRANDIAMTVREIKEQFRGVT